MAKPRTLPPLSDTQVAELRQLYDTTTNANLRLRYQMVLLAHQGRSVAEIATIVFRSRDTVERVLKRFLHGGVAAISRRKALGKAPTVTPAWKAELLRVIDLDPHTVGIRSANWTTGLLATYLAGTTQIAVTDETVRLSLRVAGYVCKRPTWSLKRKAEEQPGYVGNAYGWR
jgi:transposase